MFGHPRRPLRRKPAAGGERARAVQKDVVDEDDAETEDEARQLAVLPIARAQRQRDQREDGTGRGQRQFFLHHEPIDVGRIVVFLLELDVVMELGERHLGRPFGRRRWKHRRGVEIDGDTPEGAVIGAFRIVQARLVARAIGQLELHQTLRAVEDDASLPSEEHVRDRALRLGDEHVAPTALRRQIADVDHVIGKVLEEDLRLDVPLQRLGDDAEGELAEFQIGVGQRDNRLVSGGGRADDRHQEHRTQQPHQADAARLHRDELTIGGQSSEPDQNAEQHRHRNRDAERLRQQHVERAHDRRPGHALRNEQRALLQKGRHLQQERQEDQPENAGQDHLAKQIPIERLEHEQLTV